MSMTTYVAVPLWLVAASCKPKDTSDDQKSGGSSAIEARPSVELPKAPPEVVAAMTKQSSIRKIPLPKVRTAIKGQEDAFSTKIGTVVEVTAFYNEWLGSNGWTFEPKNSTMNPAEGVKQSLGFSTIQVWCKPTSPITTVSIIVGSGDGKDHGKSAEIWLLDLPDEESCP